MSYSTARPNASSGSSGVTKSVTPALGSSSARNRSRARACSEGSLSAVSDETRRSDETAGKGAESTGLEGAERRSGDVAFTYKGEDETQRTDDR